MPIVTSAIEIGKTLREPKQLQELDNGAGYDRELAVFYHVRVVRDDGATSSETKPQHRGAEIGDALAHPVHHHGIIAVGSCTGFVGAG